MNEQNWPKASDLNHVLATLKSDSAFKSRLLSDANSALAGIGIEIPQGLTVRVHENTESILNFTLPALSSNTELSDATLEAVAGGGITYHEGGIQQYLPANSLPSGHIG